MYSIFLKDMINNAILIFPNAFDNEAWEKKLKIYVKGISIFSLAVLHYFKMYAWVQHAILVIFSYIELLSIKIKAGFRHL